MTTFGKKLFIKKHCEKARLFWCYKAVTACIYFGAALWFFYFNRKLKKKKKKPLFWFQMFFDRYYMVSKLQLWPWSRHATFALKVSVTFEEQRGFWGSFYSGFSISTQKISVSSWNSSLKCLIQIQYILKKKKIILDGSVTCYLMLQTTTDFLSMSCTERLQWCWGIINHFCAFLSLTKHDIY